MGSIVSDVPRRSKRSTRRRQQLEKRIAGTERYTTRQGPHVSLVHHFTPMAALSVKHGASTPTPYLPRSSSPDYYFKKLESPNLLSPDTHVSRVTMPTPPTFAKNKIRQQDCTTEVRIIPPSLPGLPGPPLETPSPPPRGPSPPTAARP